MSNEITLVKRTEHRPKTLMPVQEREREIMAVGAAHNWPFRVLGVAPVPSAPVFHKNWWLVPIAQDHSQIPARTLERVQALYEAGIRPKAFLILHEAPPLLAAPDGAPEFSRAQYWARQAAKYSVTALGVTAKILLVAVPLALAVVGVGALATIGLASAVLVDPCLIAVTDNDVWVQIDYWMV